MKEIRIHGRGGQGAVTAAQLLAIAGFNEGSESQAFPKFGVERRGAPVEAYLRLSDSPINIRSQIYCPDVAIVLDPSLMEVVDVCCGVVAGGTLIINSMKQPEDLGFKGYDVCTVDASSVALEIFKADIVNTAMLGAFAKKTGLVSLKSVFKAIEEIFKRRPELIEKNKQAVQRVYNQISNT